MGQGQYDRDEIRACKVCGKTMRVGDLPNHVRYNHPDAERAQRTKFGAVAGGAIDCSICGESIGTNGIGKHMAMHARMGQYPDPAKQQTQPQKRPYNSRGEWTVSLVNGKKQIAASVSDPVAKRIIAMLVQ